MDILEEEWAELRNATDERCVVREATQLAAVLAAMIESIERNRRIGSGEIP
jgi:hypothetical protein